MSRDNLILFLFLLVGYISSLPYLTESSKITYHLEKRVVYEGIPVATEPTSYVSLTTIVSRSSDNIIYRTQVDTEYMPQIKSEVYNKITKDIKVRDQHRVNFIFPVLILLGAILLLYLLFGFLKVYEINSDSAFYWGVFSFILGLTCSMVYWII